MVDYLEPFPAATAASVLLASLTVAALFVGGQAIAFLLGRRADWMMGLLKRNSSGFAVACLSIFSVVFASAFVEMTGTWSIAGTALMVVAAMVVLACVVLAVFASVLVLTEWGCGLLGLKYSGMMLKGLRRSPVRAALSYLATFVLVFVITLVWSILAFLNQVQTEKTTDLKTIVTEKYQLPSQMPGTYAGEMRAELAEMPEGARPGKYDFMPWTFVAATLDPANRTTNNTLFFFAMDADNLLTSGGKQKAWTIRDGIDKLLGKGTLFKEEPKKPGETPAADTKPKPTPPDGFFRVRVVLPVKPADRSEDADKPRKPPEVNFPRLAGLFVVGVVFLAGLVLAVTGGTLAVLAAIVEPALVLSLGRPVSAVNWVYPGVVGTLLAVGVGVWLMQPKPPAFSGEGKIVSMMDDLDELPESQAAELREMVEKMKTTPGGVLLGKERLRLLNKKVGDSFEPTALNYKDITLKLTILGQLPEGRYDQSAVMNRSYLLQCLEQYKLDKGKEHPMAERTLNLYWIRFPDRSAFGDAATRIDSSTRFKSPSVKIEQASAAIGSFLDAYKDLVWGMRWLLAPAILASMCLVMANAISISVRERRGEMAVLKVLGFKPDAVFLLVVGEAVMVGALSGFLATSLTFYGVNAAGGIPFPVAFFPVFYIPTDALWWGPVIGGLTALTGTVAPAWTARSVKASEVFAKVS